MTALDFARVRRLVEGAHALAPQERAAWLERECAGDDALRCEVESILNAALDGPDLLERPAHLPRVESLAPRPALEPGAGFMLGGFRIVQRIASGGMGTVWEAEQLAPRRRVALKTLRFGGATRESVRRFRYEAEILARLRHPNIAQILASGVEVLGGESVPWCALEFVPGARWITQFAEERALTLPARLELFATLCRAVQHGHERGVIHRDLKPSNVLVDETGALKVIDFGVARLATPTPGLTSLHTEAGRLIGTLQYMAPEQLLDASAEADTRSDVYALGAILYELLTGQRPHDLATASLAEAARTLAEHEPARPSALRGDVARDLDAITLMALAKQRDRRYPSAEALGRDIERFLRGEPIEARSPSVGEQLAHFARRHFVLVGAASAVLTILAGATAVSLRYAFEAGRAESEARESEQAAVAERDRARFLEYTANLAAAHGALRAHDSLSARQRLEAAPPELRGFEWWRLWREMDSSVWTRTLEGVDVAPLAWLPGGERLLVANHSGAFELIAARNGARLARSAERAERLFTWSLHPSGERFAAIYSDGRVREYSVAPLAELRTWPTQALRPVWLAYSPSGAFLALSGSQGELQVWSATSGELVAELENAGVAPRPLKWSADERFLAAGTALTHQVLVWELATGRLTQRFEGHRGYISSLAFLLGGNVLASASHDHDIRLWDLDAGVCTQVLRGHDDIVWTLDADASGERLASASWDRTVRVWNARDGEQLDVLRGHVASAQSVAFAPDGEHLATTDEGLRVKLWRLEPRAATATRVRGKWGWSLSYFADSASLLAVHGGVADRWDTASERKTAEYVSGVAQWNDGALTADGERVVLGGTKGELAEFDARTGALLTLHATGSSVSALALADNGAVRVVANNVGELRAFAADGELLHEFERSASAIKALGLRPGADELASVGALGELRTHELASGRTLHVGEPTRTQANRLAWRRDGVLAAVGFADGRIRLWNAVERRWSHDLVGHEAAVFGVAFAPDGRRLASAGNDRTVRVWDLEARAEVAAWTDHSHFVNAVAFSPDGAWLASGSSDSALRWYGAGDAAERAVAELSNELRLGRLVLAALETSAELDVADRRRALELALELPDDPLDLAREAWIVARESGRSPKELTRALEAARLARAHAPEELLPQLAEAAALLRLREAPQARALLSVLAARDERAAALHALALALDGEPARADEMLKELAGRAAFERPHELKPLLDEARAALSAAR
jgi:hypothetical protein